MPVPAIARSQITEKFQTEAGGGFIKLAQELINTGAAYGRPSAEKLLPDPTTLSRSHRINLK